MEFHNPLDTHLVRTPSRRHIAALLCIATLAGGSLAYAIGATPPHEFKAGDPITATQLNAMFAELYAANNALQAEVADLQAKLPKTWPDGSYCIFKSGNSCPAGFHMDQMVIPDVQADAVPTAGSQTIGVDTSTTYCVQGGCTPQGVDGHYKVRQVIVACCK